jgi:hypothetical protein
MSHVDGRIRIDFSSKDRAEKVRRDLGSSLVGWENVVKNLP